MTSGAPAEEAAERAALEAQFRQLVDTEPDFSELSDAARRVLSVAAVLFYRHGYSATSVRELARECRLSPGALYNHFGSLEDVLWVLVAAGHREVDRALVAALAGAEGAEDRLACFVRSYTELHLRRPAYAQLVHREYVHLSTDRRAEIVELRRRIRERLVEILRQGEQQGRFALIPAPDAAVGQAMMIMDMCSRTSEWFNPTKTSADLTGRYVTAALRLAGAGRHAVG